MNGSGPYLYIPYLPASTVGTGAGGPGAGACAHASLVMGASPTAGASPAAGASGGGGGSS